MKLVLPIILVLALMPATASHCTTYTTTNPMLTVGDHYVVFDVCQPDCLLFRGVYEETNALEGLQRLDDVTDDTCHGLVPSDTIVFGIVHG